MTTEAEDFVPRASKAPDPVDLCQQLAAQRVEHRPIAELEAEIAQLKLSLAGRDKAIALLNKGMESQCEEMDRLKQDNRRLRLELDTWRTSG